MVPQKTDDMDQDDFNSSDIEYESTTNAFAYAGAVSMAEMLQHAVEDRLESKKRAKQLTFVRGSKKTQYINHLWYVRKSRPLIWSLTQPARLSPLELSCPWLMSSEVQQIH